MAESTRNGHILIKYTPTCIKHRLSANSSSVSSRTIDTFHTVVLKCKYVTKKLGQHHVVFTVDEALYCKLIEL